MCQMKLYVYLSCYGRGRSGISEGVVDVPFYLSNDKYKFIAFHISINIWKKTCLTDGMSGTT